MKKFASLFFAVLMILTVVPTTAFAEEIPTEFDSHDWHVVSETVTALNNGDTVTDILYEEIPLISAFSTVQTKTGARSYIYKNSDGVVLWQITLNATFSYISGINASCTKASYSTTIKNSAWSEASGSATKNGNKATATVRMEKKLANLVVVETDNPTITITCDVYGGLY